MVKNLDNSDLTAWNSKTSCGIELGNISFESPDCTVVIFLLHLGQKVFSWVIVKIIIYSLSNIIKYTMPRYFNYKNSNYHQEILQKTIQKILLGSTRVWTRDLQIVGPACYKRATQICYCREGFFILLKNVPCAQKIFVLLTS